jgi:hypothetical protein
MHPKNRLQPVVQYGVHRKEIGGRKGDNQRFPKVGATEKI